MDCLLSFTVNPVCGHKVRGLNLCTVYARDHEVYWLHAAGHYARISDETKGTNWSYSPTFYGLPEDDEDMIWLSYWKFGGEFEVGDRVNVSVRMPPGYYVKEYGIRVVYEKDSECDTKDIAESRSIWHQNITDRDLSRYEVGMGKVVYFLHHHPFTTPDELLKLATPDDSENVGGNHMEWRRHLVVTDPNLKYTFT